MPAPEPSRPAAHDRSTSLMTPPCTAAAAAPPRPAPRPRLRREPYAVVGRPRNEGHGKRLTAAFEALEVFPALAESRNRLLALIAEERPSTGDVVARDRVRRRARDRRPAARQRRSSRPSAARSSRSSPPSRSSRPRPSSSSPPTPRPSSSSSAARRGTPRPSASGCTPSPSSAPPTASPPQAGYPHRDRLLVTALLHDVGKLVLMHAYPGYPKQVHGPARTPEERLHYERRELGVDHALVGGVLARRWNLPHVDRLRDRAPPLRRRRRATPPSSASPTCSRTTRRARRSPRIELLRAARAVGFGPTELRSVLYDLPYPSSQRPRSVEPCPLSGARARGPQAPRQGHGLQADRPRALALARARCARTCTTSTASSARSTAPRPCSTPPSAAGSRPSRRSGAFAGIAGDLHSHPSRDLPVPRRRGRRAPGRARVAWRAPAGHATARATSRRSARAPSSSPIRGPAGRRSARPDWDAIPARAAARPRSARSATRSPPSSDRRRRRRPLAQTPEEQREAAERLHLPYPLLSDARGELAAALELPTFDWRGRPLLKRVTLLLRDEEDRRRHVSGFPPDGAAAAALARLDPGRIDGRALDHHQVALRDPRPGRARARRRRRARPDRRARPPARHPGPVPRAALRRRCAARASCAPSAASRAATRSPATRREVTVLEVVELLDGPLGGGAESIFAEAAAAARAVLAKATIADVLDAENRAAGAYVYYI